MTERTYISCANTAKLVRSALAESFPGVKFSVRSSVYSGGASIDVSWVDGPTSDQVKSVSNHFEGAYFDGMIDYKGCIYHALDGQPVRFGANFIFERRECSDALVQRAIDAIVTGYGGCEPITVAGYRNGNAHTWRNIGGCDLGQALQCWLSGNNAGADWITPDQGMQPKPSKTLARVKFAGSDEYGAPYGSNGYPRAA
jgi:Large polyvalent protein associated domain 29